MRRKNGFTMVELMVVLTILGILAAIAAPNLTEYIKRVQFRRNEEHAKTIYLDAEANLTYLRTSGQWEDFRSEIRATAAKNDSLSGSLGADIYVLRTKQDGENALLERLIGKDTYDGEVLNAFVGVEIDATSGHVYSVFYSTTSGELSYGGSVPTEGDMDDRAYPSRIERRLGYYSAKDKVNVVDLEMTRLRIQSISLENGEELTLNWSSNSTRDNRDTKFRVEIYNAVSPYALLWKTEIVPGEIRDGCIGLKLNDENKTYVFPLTQVGGRFRLTLDAMMDAGLFELAGRGGDGSDNAKLYGTSITRLPNMQTPMDIFAKIKAIPSGEVEGEYQESDYARSNSANTMFAEGSREGHYQIAAFRHLSNIRNIAGAAQYTVRGALNWNASDVAVYRSAEIFGAARAGGMAREEGNIVFPTIEELPAGSTLQGGGTAIRNLRLGRASVTGTKRYLGLFGENRGTISGLILDGASIDASGPFYGVGAFCGRSSGVLHDLAVKDLNRDSAALPEISLDEAGETLGIGGVAGIVELGGAAGADQIKNLEVSGAIAGAFPAMTGSPSWGIGGVIGCVKGNEACTISGMKNAAEVSGGYAVGGVTGNLSLVSLKDCKNTGLVRGTGSDPRYIGGIAGYVKDGTLQDCTSDPGRSRGEAFRGETDRAKLLGTYVGGVVGYADRASIRNCATTAGYVMGGDYVGGIAGGLTGGSSIETKRIRDDGTEEMAVTESAAYVIGNHHVGGIVGFSESSELKNCVNRGVATGYGRFVGGIVGYNGAEGHIVNCASSVSDPDGSIYRRVVGWKPTADCVGGIAGYNSGRITFSGGTGDDRNPAANAGMAPIAVGGSYVGGVTGFNDAGGTIQMSNRPVGGRVYAAGDCAGGIAGLNASTGLRGMTVKAESVEGRRFVGGAIGANVVSGDYVLTGVRTENAEGTVSGEVFVGGLIGYHGNVESGKAALLAPKDPEERATEQQIRAVLPTVNGAGGIPSYLGTPGTPVFTFSITGTEDGAGEPAVLNRMQVRAAAYAGGIVGACHPDSAMKLTGCANAGDLRKQEAGTLTGGVDMIRYLTVSGEADAADCLRGGLAGSETLYADLVGGIVGVNGKNHTIVNCAGSGQLRGFRALGSIVGLNQGAIRDCTVRASLNQTTQDYVGGVAGLNTGEVTGCTLAKGFNVQGRYAVGGVVGFNLEGGRLSGNRCYANVWGTHYVGGLAGKNAGTIDLRVTWGDTATVGGNERDTESRDEEKIRIHGVTEGVGGVTGVNCANGRLLLRAEGDETGISPATGRGVIVTGGSAVGGVVGVNEGSLGTSAEARLENRAMLVQSTALENGQVGGVVGVQKTGTLEYAGNWGEVKAVSGHAGGVISKVEEGAVVQNCVDYGSVSCDEGYAGGVAGENCGVIQDCSVQNLSDTEELRISSGREACGGVVAVNRATGKIRRAPAAPEAAGPAEEPEIPPSAGLLFHGRVRLAGGVSIYGMVAGENYGEVSGIIVDGFPRFDPGGEKTVGGVVGRNNAGGIIRDVTSQTTFEDLGGIRYLGGVVGVNAPGATVGGFGADEGCVFAGAIRETTRQSAAGGCFGGIAGLNEGTLQGCTTRGVELSIFGVYDAASAGPAAEKESLSTHLGGIAGKNGETGVIEGCYTGSMGAADWISAGCGMAGGIVGYNKGTVVGSGDGSTAVLMAYVDRNGADAKQEAEKLMASCGGLAEGWINKTNRPYVLWPAGSGTSLDELQFSDGVPVIAGRGLCLTVNGGGSVGGIAGYNGPTGIVTCCASGNWAVVNRSETAGAGAGGVIGMNESAGDLRYLVNQAFVGCETGDPDGTGRFAGGVVGSQNNSASDSWVIEGCLNFGMVCGYRTYSSGGIVGQWTGNGGTIENCRNYADLQTGCPEENHGASAGIVARLYHAAAGQSFNILDCRNDGNLYTQNGPSSQDGANDSAGILGSVTDDGGWSFTVNIAGCVNGPGVEIYSSSTASGIVGHICADTPENDEPAAGVILNISQCRNYAAVLDGGHSSAGIFGDAGSTTFIQDCFTAEDPNREEYPAVSLDMDENLREDGESGELPEPIPAETPADPAPAPTETEEQAVPQTASEHEPSEPQPAPEYEPYEPQPAPEAWYVPQTEAWSELQTMAEGSYIVQPAPMEGPDEWQTEIFPGGEFTADAEEDDPFGWVEKF